MKRMALAWCCNKFMPHFKMCLYFGERLIRQASFTHSFIDITVLRSTTDADWVWVSVFQIYCRHALNAVAQSGVGHDKRWSLRNVTDTQTQNQGIFFLFSFFFERAFAFSFHSQWLHESQSFLGHWKVITGTVKVPHQLICPSYRC